MREHPFILMLNHRLFLRPTVFQAHNAVEYQMTCAVVCAVGDEIAVALELKMRFGCNVC